MPFYQTRKYFLLIAIGFVVFFAVLRLYKMRDADGQKLPPSFPARTFFLLTHVLLYVAIVIALFYSPELFRVAKVITSGSAFEPFWRRSRC